MKDILESIILNIVDDRDAVSISEKIDGENIGLLCKGCK